MNRKLRSWTLLTVPAIVIGGMTASGCDKATQLSEEVCGPCGTLATGDFSVSGNAQLDGFFQATGTFTSATAKIQGDFEDNLRALANVYGVTIAANVSIGDITDQVTGAIQADITANVQGGLKVNYKPPQCTASLDVAVQAQAHCEASAKCDVTVNPGHAAVSCKGSCTGSCSAGCTGDFSCAVKAPGITCTGQCEGTCQLDAAATCDGVCHGTCSGTCSAKDASGQCAGTCTGGTCTGSCELKAQATCAGKCNGTCNVKQGTAECTADAECHGSCAGSCTGSCVGEFDPPSASANCSASADCQAQAKAQANASLDCTPPSLDVTYQFAATADAKAQAAFTARLAELKVRGSAILQGFGKLEALIDGKVNGQVVFNPSPSAQLLASVKGFATADAVANLNIPSGRLACVVPAFETAVTALTGAAGSVAGTLTAQAKFAAVFTG